MKRAYSVCRSVVGAACGSVEARNGTTVKPLIGGPELIRSPIGPLPNAKFGRRAVLPLRPYGRITVPLEGYRGYVR